MDPFADLYPQYDIHVYGIDEKIIQENIKDDFFITGNDFYQNLLDVYPGYLPDGIFEVIEPDKSDKFLNLRSPCSSPMKQLLFILPLDRDSIFVPLSY